MAVFGQAVVRVVGRVLDKNGEPFANAEITYSPDPTADMIPQTKSGPDGRFEFRASAVSDRGMIWVTSGIDWANWRVLVPPGSNLWSKYLNGLGPIKLRNARPPETIDLGDVPIMSYYSPITIRIGEKWRDRVFNTDDAISFRVTDMDGHVAANPKGGRGLDPDNSTITIALPSGKWKVEFKTSRMGWQTIAKRIVVAAQRPQVIDFPRMPRTSSVQK